MAFFRSIEFGGKQNNTIQLANDIIFYLKSTYRYIVGINVVGAFVIVNGLQFKARMVVWKNIGKSIFRSITWQIGKCARLIASNMLKLFKLFAETIEAVLSLIIFFLFMHSIFTVFHMAEFQIVLTESLNRLTSFGNGP